MSRCFQYLLLTLVTTLGVSLGADETDKPQDKKEKPAKHAAAAAPQAVQVLVQPANGGKVTGVGFRATVLKAAIRWNLAGSAVNSPTGTQPPTMTFVLQGDPLAIQAAMEVIAKGPGISTKSFTFTQSIIPVDPNLKSFEVKGWTSTSRGITNPYDLCYFVDPSPKAPILGEPGAKVCYREILYYCVTDPADREKIDKAKADVLGD
jgi:acylphosphatase